MSRTAIRLQVAVLAFVMVLVTAVVLLVASPGPGLLLALAIAPACFLLWHFYHADEYKHESKRLLGGTFLLGALSVIPAFFIEILFERPSSDAGVLVIFFYFVFVVGLTEELMKFISVRIYPYRSKQFDEPMDGIVFGVAAALGFATVENILYVLEGGIWTAVFRAIVSVPVHAFCGAILGFYLGEAKVRGRPLLALNGLLFAASLHGLFDTLSTVISSSVAALISLLAFVWVVYFKVVKKEITEAEAESPYRSRPDAPTSPKRQISTFQGAMKLCTQCGAHCQQSDKFCVSCGHRFDR